MKSANLYRLVLACLTLILVSCGDDQTNTANNRSDISSELRTIASEPVSSISSDHQDHKVTVYKSPTCGCCTEWVEHLDKAGFHPLVKHPNNLNSIKGQFNIESQYQSCHTAVHQAGNEQYVFEGHIPVKFIQQFLKNPPAGATGLTVPGMPLGSPGMEVQQRFTPYTIYQLNAGGEPTVFATVSSMEEQY